MTVGNQPARVDLDRKLVRVGWRTVPFDQLHHVYRMPGGKHADQAVLQLEISDGVDARLPLSSDALPDLTLNELEVLLTVLEQAPIEPKPGIPLRPPIADELGTRVGAELVADHIGAALMPFGRAAYSKPTALQEVRHRIEAVRKSDGASGEARLPDPNDFSRAFSALMSGLNQANLGHPKATIMPKETRPIINGDYGRGVWGTGRKTFRQHRDNVEGWLRSERVPVTRNYARTSAIGWSIVAVALLWPLPAWGGLILIHRDRIRRFAANRSAALNAMVTGCTVPSEVKRFFGAPFPERAYAKNVYVLGVVMSVILLVGGLLLMTLGMGQVGGPYVPEPWQFPLGLVFLVCGVPVVVGVVRWQKRMIGELARAGVEWELLTAKR